MKNGHGVALILVNMQAEDCNFAKINIPPWVSFTFFKLYKRYQIVQRITNDLDNLASYLQLLEQQKIHYFIFGLKSKLILVLFMRQSQNL